MKEVWVNDKMTRENLLRLIFNKKWNLIKNISFQDLLFLLNYIECMSLAYDLFFKNLHDDEIQDFSVRLFFDIRDYFDSDWNADWKNDAFLGQLCGLTWRYDESYDCFKRAYDKLDDPPDSLLLALSVCNNAPGTPPISDEESEVFFKKAVSKKITYEAALQMRALARRKKMEVETQYWNKMCDQLEERNIHTDMILPDIFQNKMLER